MKKPNLLKETKQILIRFSEVDSMNIVWHGSYVQYFEDAREAFGRKYGLTYQNYFDNGFYAPLVDMQFEFKNPFDPSATVDNAFNQVKHYTRDIPLLFEYNALTVISDGTETLLGMYSASREWYSPWKSINGVDVVEGGHALHALVNGLLVKDRLLRYIKDFIFHEDHNGTLIKKGAKYHQFFGVLFAVEHTRKAIKPSGDGRIGVIWHTQGAGKSISMAIYAGILRQLPELKNPTILVQVDRRDLDSQLYDNFVYAKDLVGEVSHADSTNDLRRKIGRASCRERV
mgnify:CR=1 FL=1